MAEEKKIVLTSAGLANLEKELEHLKVVRRKEVAAKIKEARAQGDLSENAEYDAAMDEQAEIEARIATIEKMFRNVEVIDEEELNTGKVNLGNTVTVLDMDFEEEFTYAIVGPAEADPANFKLSNESPLGMALMGHSVGDVVQNNAPDGIIEFKILNIE